MLHTLLKNANIKFTIMYNLPFVLNSKENYQHCNYRYEHFNIEFALVFD